MVPLRSGRLFGGPPETLVLGDVQYDAYTFSALVREVARSQTRDPGMVWYVLIHSSYSLSRINQFRLSRRV
jgi:hypothetical protein